MQKYYDVIRRIVDLAETCHEGIVHIKNKLAEGYFGETLPLMEDVTQAFLSIEGALQPLLPMLLSEQLEPLTEQLSESFYSLVSAYKRDNRERALEVIEGEFLPSFQIWHCELDRTLLPIITL
ncbi:conserved hypothetical protein [Desulforamulus reducens MI-1]|uniref:DUF8042 domain-containing protein n=1 Tax=Desulforamulus reducens (strain ATCC BAA-1160 / DSM 100696 / MI-1) TaxID=349161 RepID=A4J776_DESRM|nr:hypothetical protein [Desulforamulus reducens]ABO50929.1 conserved hypothetical protein [Desulforamulus reducens MI-1]